MSQAWVLSIPCRLQSACIHRATSATLVLRQPTTQRTSTWREHWSSRQTIQSGQKRWGPLWGQWYIKWFIPWGKQCIYTETASIILAHRLTEYDASVWTHINICLKKNVLPPSGEGSAFNWIKPTQERNWCWRPSTYHSHACCLRRGAGWVIQLKRW